jgi:hypothetical protein
MTAAYAEHLLGLEKYITVDGEIIRTLPLTLSSPLQIHWKLKAPAEMELDLRVEIQESPKKALKIGFHHQDDTSQHGLLRVDYHSRHRNPADITSAVPQHFQPYAGMFLDNWPGHIHHVVDGYPPLAWAVPLEADTFPVKDIQGMDHVYSAVLAFCKRLNIVTEVKINNPQLRVL